MFAAYLTIYFWWLMLTVGRVVGDSFVFIFICKGSYKLILATEPSSMFAFGTNQGFII